MQNFVLFSKKNLHRQKNILLYFCDSLQLTFLKKHKDTVLPLI